MALGVDSQFFSAIVLFENQPFPRVLCSFLERRIPGKNWEVTSRMVSENSSQKMGQPKTHGHTCRQKPVKKVLVVFLPMSETIPRLTLLPLRSHPGKVISRRCSVRCSGQGHCRPSSPKCKSFRLPTLSGTANARESATVNDTISLLQHWTISPSDIPRIHMAVFWRTSG